MLEVVIALSLAVLVGSAIAHKTRITPAIVLIFIGLAIGIMPAHELHEVQSIGLPPHVILEIFLPIMLFWEARNTSWREARNRIRGIILTGTLLVIVTAFGVAGILHAFAGVSVWGAALLIGVALAPTDAVAVATLNGKLPKSAITTLKAEALINDGTTLVLLALALQVAAGQELALGHASGMFFFSFLIGILVGLAVGWVANKIRAHIDNPMWFTYGLPTWAFVTFVMNAVLFVMVGVQLPTAVERMGVTINLYGTTWGYGLLVVLAAWIACVVIRYVFLQVSIFMIRLLDRSEKQRTLRTTHRGRIVSTMAGLRGGVSLAVALSIPASVEYRDFVIFVVSGVVLCSMVLQGMLLPAVIRWANLPVDNSEEEEMNEAVRTMIAESFDSIQEIGGRINAPQEVIDRIAEEYMFNMSMYRNLHTLHMHGDDTPENVLKVLEANEKEKELRLGVLEVQRDILKRLRDEGRIDTNVLHQIQERLDIEVMRVLGPLELE